VRGSVRRKPAWLVRPPGLDTVRNQASAMEVETRNSTNRRLPVLGTRLGGVLQASGSAALRRPFTEVGISAGQSAYAAAHLFVGNVPAGVFMKRCHAACER
jgi:hypothetical protein